MTLNDLTKLFVAFLTFSGLGATQCACSDTEQARQIAVWREASLFAKEHGFAGTANLNINGQPAFDLRTGGILSTGMSGNISLQFNSLAEPRGKASTAVGDMNDLSNPVDEIDTSKTNVDSVNK